jgi:ketosteroid isomerase-like protein
VVGLGKWAPMDRSHVTDWVTAYERAWRSAGTAGLVDLFTPDATYVQAPYREPVVGLPAIARMWDAERDGPDEAFRMTHETVAVDGNTAVARIAVEYGDPVDEEYRDLWIMRFAADGRCRHFEEWPFAPSQPEA